MRDIDLGTGEFEAPIRTAIQTVKLDQVKAGHYQPTWEPAIAVFGECHGGADRPHDSHLCSLMYMGTERADDDTAIHQYKHGMTRRYLCIDDDGVIWTRAWGNGQTGPWTRAAHPGAEILRAFGVEIQAYDDEFKAERDRRLRAAGYGVITG